jgi:hypothetical protein
MKSVVLGCVFAILLFFVSVVRADERVGTFSIEEIRLRPTFLSTEADGGVFSLSDSSFSLRWRKDKKLSAFVGIGSELSRNLPIYYDALSEDRLGFYEAYAEYNTLYGRFRLGLLPLNFGYDGVLKFSERYYNRTLPVSQRIIGLRDEGVSFYTDYNGYYTELIAHNGEIDTPNDGRLWVTGNWGYTNDRNFRAQLSMQTGDVKSDIASTTNTIAGVVQGETAKWRNGLFFVNWYPRNWNVVAEFGGGEVVQSSHKGRYSHNLFEGTRFFSKNFGTGLRYDQLDPDRNVEGDIITEASLVLVFKSDDSTSGVYILGTKVIEESNEKPNDEVRLVWLLTPYSR